MLPKILNEKLLSKGRISKTQMTNLWIALYLAMVSGQRGGVHQ